MSYWRQDKKNTKSILAFKSKVAEWVSVYPSYQLVPTYFLWAWCYHRNQKHAQDSISFPLLSASCHFSMPSPNAAPMLFTGLKHLHLNPVAPAKCESQWHTRDTGRHFLHLNPFIGTQFYVTFQGCPQICCLFFPPMWPWQCKAMYG